MIKSEEVVSDMNSRVSAMSLDQLGGFVTASHYHTPLHHHAHLSTSQHNTHSLSPHTHTLSHATTHAHGHSGTHLLPHHNPSAQSYRAGNLLPAGNFPLMGGDSPTSELVDEKPYMDRKYYASAVDATPTATQHYGLSALHNMGTPPASSSPIPPYGVLMTAHSVGSVSPNSSSKTPTDQEMYVSSSAAKPLQLQPIVNHQYASTIKYCSNNTILSANDYHQLTIHEADQQQQQQQQSQQEQQSQQQQQSQQNSPVSGSFLSRISGSSTQVDMPSVLNYSSASSSPAKLPNGSESLTASNTAISQDTAGKTNSSSAQQQDNSAPDTTKKSGTRRPEKPALSYINMIGHAIKESPTGKLTLSEIYAYLQKRWVNQTAWLSNEIESGTDPITNLGYLSYLFYSVSNC